MRKFLLAGLMVLFSCVAAQAHFMWVEALPSDKADKVHVRVSFAEVPGEGESFLMEKVKNIKVLPIAENNAVAAEPVKLEAVKSGDIGAWEGDTSGKLAGLQLSYDYGVLTKRGETFWLNYHSQSLKSPLTKQSKPVKGNAPLQVVAKVVDSEIELQVLLNDKPLKDAPVVLWWGLSGDKEFKTNDQGIVRVENQSPKALFVRADYIDKTAGEHDGKKYDSVKHYATLTVPGEGTKKSIGAEIKPVSAKKEASHKISAKELLANARNNRNIWEKFPGVEAKITLSENGKVHEGKLIINDKGTVKLEMPDSPAQKWAEEYLNMMSDHRMPSSNDTENVTYAKDEENHPLGTLVSLGDGEQDSYYRIRDNIIYEVNRRMGKGRFTICVLDVEKNKTGKYLPSVYTMSFWDEKGALVTTLTEHDYWIDHKGFDMPEKIVQITAEKNQRVVRVLEFKDYKLTDKAAK